MTVMFEHKDLVVGTRDGMVVIANDATVIHLTREQAHWLSVAALPAALAQLGYPFAIDDSDAT